MTNRLLTAALALMATVSAGCPDQGPANANMLIQMRACVENMEKGDFAKAETRCQLCLEYDEKVPECLNALGIIHYNWGDEEKARSFFKRAVRDNNDFAQARNNLGYIEFNNGNYEAAIPYFESAIEIDPRYLDGRYNLALSHLRLGQRAYADELDPDRKLDAVTAEYKKAEDQYRRIIELYPEDFRPYHDLGVIMSYRAEVSKIENRRREFISDSEQYFVRCLDLAPENKECHGNLAHLFLGTGRFDEALFHYVQCLAADKNDPICGTEIKAAYEGSQLKSEALSKYMTQLAENPGYGLGHYGFCIALFEKGLVDMAVTECENALKLDESLCLANYQLALHYKKVLDKDLTIQNCRGLIECAQDKYEAEVAECKEIVQALEVQ